jgi:dTDP-4-amino-4,6-dideoxygalactose transaminase
MSDQATGKAVFESSAQLEKLGGALHVGRPNIGNKKDFLKRVDGILDRRWLSNDGPMVREFEARVADLLGVRHVVAVCNATVGIELASRAIGLSGEVIMPSYTFVATAHALQWQGIKPVFADMDPMTHNIDAEKIEALITPETTGIVGVHVWGRACHTQAIGDIAAKHGLKVMYDASHGFACSAGGRMLGNFGACEVFSFHATKFINCLEGGAVTTNDDVLAEKMRLMRNFGFKGFDNVVYLGVNGKMNEVCAAMGLTNLEAIEEIVEVNKRNYLAYRRELNGVTGISVIGYDPDERNNYQYVVIEADPDVCPCKRDEIVEALHEENVIARKYFWPGCHRMEPYRTTQPETWKRLPETERVAARVIVLPTGQTVDEGTIRRVCELIREAAKK